ncbi:MAG: response regulator transcription factor [Bacilli bacterium]
MKQTILIADDEQRLRFLLNDFLSSKGFLILEASNGQEALDIFYKNPTIHLVILDVMMPIIDGWDTCKKIREQSNVPIIILTAKNQEKDELYGFYNGADEFIKKPFSLTVLLARIKSLIKRTIPVEINYEKGIITIDQEKHIVLVNGINIYLSKIEFRLLNYFIQNEEKVLSRNQILDFVWGFDYDGIDRTVDTHINRLRTKLGKASDYISTIRGYGYKFEVIE